MKILVTGVTGSGKSLFAETLTLKFSSPHYYIAAMKPDYKDARERIIKHRKMRAGKGFITLGHFTDIGTAGIERNGTVLLECVSNLLANEMFDAGGNLGERVLNGLTELSNKCANIIIVTNKFVYSEKYDEPTKEYIKQQSLLNKKIAELCDEVYEICNNNVAGVHKNPCT
jgi:adenosylcobinamide kinase/adenosylcobinamide-phosphate guanylyltransferase